MYMERHHEMFHKDSYVRNILFEPINEDMLSRLKTYIEKSALNAGFDECNVEITFKNGQLKCQQTALLKTDKDVTSEFKYEWCIEAV